MGLPRADPGGGGNAQLSDQSPAWTFREANSGEAAEVQFVYRGNLAPGALGGTLVLTALIPSGTRSFCTDGDIHQDAPGEEILSAEVDFAVRSDWYTAWDRTNAWWDDCPHPETPCSKLFDFGSTAAHEIGHVFGLGHPQDVDLWFHPDSRESEEYARCRTVLLSQSDATMCPYGDIDRNRYHPWRRTLLWYDADSLDALWERMY